MRAARFGLSPLNFDRVEAHAVLDDGHVRDMKARVSNHATQLIEDFMIAVSEVIARSLSDAVVSSIRRVVVPSVPRRRTAKE